VLVAKVVTIDRFVSAAALVGYFDLFADGCTSGVDIWHLEIARNGPLWDTLDKLTRGPGVSRKDLGVTWQPLA